METDKEGTVIAFIDVPHLRRELSIVRGDDTESVSSLLKTIIKDFRASYPNFDLSNRITIGRFNPIEPDEQGEILKSLGIVTPPNDTE
jgi:hypothetical protein